MMWRAVFAMTFLALCLGACGARDQDSPRLRIDLVAGSFDIARTLTGATQIGLVGVDASGNVVPALASSWRIAGDGRSVIFRLRPRNWPGGKPVSAADVVASFRRIADPRSHSPGRPLLAAFDNGSAVLRGAAPVATLGIDAPVADVVEVRTAGAMPGLLALLAQPDLVVMAPGLRPPPLGAFRMGDVARRPIDLVPNTAAPPGSRAAASIALTPVDDPGPAIARFAHDRTDLVIGHGMAGFDDARLLTGSNVLRVEPTWGVYGYLVRPAGALADLRVRRALAMAIDRDDLGSRLFGVALAPVLGVVPSLPSEPAPALPDWAIEAPAARLDLAMQLLQAAGFDATHPLTVTISLPEGREHSNVAAEIATDWARVGVRTATIVRSASAHAAALRRGDYELAVVERTAAVDNAVFFLDPFNCEAGSYCNPGADALVAAARTATDASTAATSLAAAESSMVADTPMIALFTPIRWALVAPRVTGWTANVGGQHPLALLSIKRRQPLGSNR